MDLWLPVDPASLYGAGQYGPRYWRDIQRSDPVEIVRDPAPADPIDLSRAKTQCRIDTDVTDFDELLSDLIVIARRKVQKDTGFALVPSAWEMTFDRFPLERFIPLPNPPLTDITGLWSTDVFGTETLVSAATYYADLNATPGRLILQPAVVWPTGTRNEQGGRVQWTSGYAASAVPDMWRQAMLMLIAHWFRNREATARPRLDPTDAIPLGYDSLIGDARVAIG